MGNPIVCSLYTTSRCEGSCRHCLVRSPYPGDADFDNVERNLIAFRRLGGRYVDLTGGNPLLVDWLPEALRLCRSLGLWSSLTVSGKMIPRRIDEWGTDWLALPRFLRLSFDGDERFHNDNRGEGNHEATAFGLETVARVPRETRPQLIFTIIPGPTGNLNRHQFASVIRLARQYRSPTNVNPILNINVAFGEGTLPPENGAPLFTPEQWSDMYWLARQADVQFSQGKMGFLARGGNNPINPTCRAVHDVITISSDNQLILPCYYYRQEALSLEDGLQSALDSPVRKELLLHDGRHDFCKGCTIWCYVMPSLLHHWWDRVVAWQHALSAPQGIRDVALRAFGRLHRDCPYPDFKLD